MLDLPALGLGCASLATLTPDTDDEAVAALLEATFAAGIGYVDVAPLYGSGRGETLLGRALAATGRSVRVSTKVGYIVEAPFGVRPDPDQRWQDFSAGAIRTSVERSLARLGRDKLDLVLLHDPVDHIDDAARTAFPALVRLKEEGVIGAIGLGTNSVATATALMDRVPLDAILVAGRLTLLDASAETLAEACRKRGIAVIAGGIFNSGILAGDTPTFDYVPASPAIRAATGRMAALCAAAGTSLRTAALQAARRHQGVACTLIGPRTLAELEDLLTRWTAPIPETLWPHLVEVRP